MHRAPTMAGIRTKPKKYYAFIIITFQYYNRTFPRRNMGMYEMNGLKLLKIKPFGEDLIF